jgi:protocatechuate 3,4-dioxygenase beta subunit
MFSSTHQKLICVLIVLSCAGLANAQTSPLKELTSTISGKVMLKDKPLAGVVINVSSTRRSPQDRALSYKAKTDANGEYRITNVAAGNYVITPLAPAFVIDEDPSQARTLIVNKGETIEHIDFALLRGGAITGKVVDADGHPVIEEQVVVFSAQTNQRFYMPSMDQRTDDRGIYRIYGLRPGSYKVAAGQGDEGSYGGYRPATFKRAFHPSTPDLAQATVIELSEGGEATNVDIALGRGLNTYSASGRIVDAQTGQPLANIGYGVVHYVSPTQSSSMSNGSVSNSRGEFKLDNLVPGKYAVQIRTQPGSNWRADDVPFEITDDDVNGLVVRTSRGATLSGVIVLEGDADKSARDELRRMMVTAVSEQQQDRAFSSSWAMVTPDGSFSISGVASGTVVLRLGNSARFRLTRVERGGVVQGRGIEVKEGETIGDVRMVVVYGNASIRGAIELTNNPLPPSARFYVWLRSVSDDPANPSMNAPGEVDARGQFLIEGLMPGTYEVTGGVVNNEPTRTMLLGAKTQQVVVTAGSVNNITLSVELKENRAKP